MLLRTLVDVYSKVASFSEKLRKVDVVAEFLKNTPEELLSAVCYMLKGSIFPEYSSKDLDVGWSTLWGCILKAANVSEDKLVEAYNTFGDLGLAAEHVFKVKRKVGMLSLDVTPLTVEETYNTLLEIAEIKGESSLKRKQKIIVNLLGKASPEEAKFIVKIVTGEMRYGFKEGLLEESISKAFTVSLDLVKRAYMVTSDIGYVAQLAKANPTMLEKLNIKPGIPVKHMLAETAERLENGFERYGKAFFEFKYDGARLTVHKGEDGLVKIFTRRCEDVTLSLPEIVEEVKNTPHSFILDGEVVPFERKPKAYQYLIRRLRRKYDVEEYAKLIPVKLYIFDLLYLDGVSLIDLPLVERRKRLEEVFSSSRYVEVSRGILTSNVEEAKKFFEEALKQGFEGLMIKDPSSKYTLGRRGLGWLKFKGEAETLDLVVVAVEYGHGKRAKVLSDYTFAAKDENGRLIPVAKAYCGLTDKEIEEMTKLFKSITVKDEGRKLIVQPKIVVEVAFGEVQKSPSYPSGYSLRFPRIKKIRWDKTPEEIDTINRIKEIYEKQVKSET
ncbi:MAG: ATP-dependent DNA ligase [Candidatus Bathyarchaeota archaeon]